MAVQEKDLKGNTPHWPTHKDLLEGSPNRIRLGAPLENEDLVRRYIQVFNDMRDLDWSKWDMKGSYIDFEHALADLKACEECDAADVSSVAVKDSQNRERRWYRVPGCRTFCGHSAFKELDRAKTRLLGRPVFALRNCQGPEWRKEQLARIYEGSAKMRTTKKGDALLG
jgi:hypothetical protein